MFVPVAPENYLPRLTLMENVLYGRISAIAGVQGELIEDVARRCWMKTGSNGWLLKLFLMSEPVWVEPICQHLSRTRGVLPCGYQAA